MKIADVMTTDVVTARTDTPFFEIVRVMSDHGISGLPVVDDRGHVLGVVSEGDLLVKGHRPNRVRIRAPREDLIDVEREYERRLQGTTAGELMTSPAVTIDGDEDLRMGARSLSLYAIGRIPVTCGGVLAGILTRADVIRSLVRSDEEIREEVARVLETIVLADTDAVTFDIHDGVLTLHGKVERRSTARLIAAHCDRIVGVVRLDVGELRSAG